MNSKLYLVDGSGYIFRAYYAVAPLSNAEGLPTNALLGFCRMLKKLLRDVEAEYIAVTFDTGEPTFRHKMYDGYKANRGECPEDLIPQMPYFRKIVEALGVKQFEKPGFEADDIIGTLANKLSDKFEKVVIVSGDKDLAQLVNDKVEVWDPMRDALYDIEGVKKKFGVTPSQVIDYLALCGDSSDNIPGVKGIGPKTAEKLIEHFGNVESLIEKSAEIEEIKGLRGASGVRKKIESETENLRLSKDLVSLDLDVEPFSKISNVEEFHWKEHVEELFWPLMDELGFESLFKGKVARTEAPKQNGKHYELVSPKTLNKFLNKLSKQEEFAFDTETTSLDPRDCELLGISFSWKSGEAYYLPLAGVVEKEELLDADLVREKLNPIFSNTKVKKLGHNLKFDLEVLFEKGYEISGELFDSLLASHLLAPDLRQHGLKALSKRYLAESMKTYEEILGDKEHLGEVAVSEVYKYACHDADSSFSIRESLVEELKKEGEKLLTSLSQVECPLVSVLAKMELRGIEIDTEFLENLRVEFDDELQILESEIHEIAGEPFNLNSPKQLNEILFQKLGIPTKGIKKRQAGFSTDVKVLTKLAPDYDIAEKLLSYRELHKLNSTYVEALIRLTDPKTKRIYSSFNQAITATGRLSSSDPNLQNIPIRTARGRRIRKAFVASKGQRLISADYSQIELRVLAHLSGDKTLSDAFRKDEDIHVRTARELFGSMLSEEELKDLRRIAKTMNFGIIYGMSAFRLAAELNVSRNQAQDYIDSYFARYPKVKAYFEHLDRSADDLGYVETLFGRRRYLRDIETSGRDAGYLKRSLLNAPVQGTAAEVIKCAMINLDKKLEEFGKAKMLLQVHDELVFEVQEGAVDQAVELIVNDMESAVELDVPLRVDVRVANNWGGE